MITNRECDFLDIIAQKGAKLWYSYAILLPLTGLNFAPPFDPPLFTFSFYLREGGRGDPY